MASNIAGTLEGLMKLDGAMAAAVVDSESGMALGMTGSGLNLDLAAASNSEVLRAMGKVLRNLGMNDRIEDILTSLGKQYHLLRPLTSNDKLFIYLVLNRGKANLAMARHKLTEAEAGLEV